MNKLNSLRYLFLMLLMLVASAGSAEIHIVEQISTSFMPAELVINVGDTVWWVWNNGSHTVTNGLGASDPEAGTLFDEPLNAANTLFMYDFLEPGEVPYFCRPHEFIDMRGVVIVQQQDGCFLNCPAGDGGLISAAGSGNKSPDIDGSGDVNVTDFAQFATAFGGMDYCSDFDCSGAVDVTDFAIFATHFGHGPGDAGVCE